MKKKIVKKTLIIGVTIIIALCFLGITNKSNATEKYEDWEYKINDDQTTITLTNFSGAETNLVIPSKIGNYTVTGIYGNGITNNTYSVFEHYNSIETVKVPSTINEIGSYAFMGCKNLKSIELSEGLEKIGNCAFYNCEKLQQINIPSTVKIIDCNSEFNPFDTCYELTEINVNNNNINYSSLDGVLFNKDKSILISYPGAKKDTKYTVPLSVRQIYAIAFEKNDSLKTVNIQSNVTKMQGNGWIESLGGYEFSIQDCKNLQEIIVSEDNQAFYSENGIIYNKDKTKILCYPYGKKDTYFCIPETVSKIKNMAFKNEFLEKININSKIDDARFLTEIKKLKIIEVNDSNTNFISEKGVLLSKDKNELICYPRGKEDKEYEVNNNVKKIGKNAFKESNIEKIILPDTITDIEEEAFYGCKKLKEIGISKNLTRIRKRVFYNCTGLKEVTIPKLVVEIEDEAFYNCCNLNILQFEENSKIKKIGNKAFNNCKNIEVVNIPEGTEQINASFRYCKKIMNINIPSTLLNLPTYTFDFRRRYSTNYNSQ